MKLNFKIVGQLMLLISLLVPAALMGQQSATTKPYHEGPVWDIATVHVKYGMEDRYLNYLATDYKREQDALKNAGYILDYKVITTEPHGPQDFDVILMTEFKDLATMEANSDKMEALAMQIEGGRPKAEAGAQQRTDYREILGNRLGREIILEPKPAK